MPDPGGLRPQLGVVLAGGRGTRMGAPDKPLLPIGGKPMLTRVVERLAPQVLQVIINANGDPGRFAAFDLPIVPDTVEGFAGPLAGVHAGMLWARAHAPEARFVLSVAADTPFFPTDLAFRLSEGCGRDESTIALAASGSGTHPVFGLWPVALADALEAFLRAGESKILAFANQHSRLNVPFADVVLPDGTSVDPFFNVNTPEEAGRAEDIAAALERVAA
jgi:molybdopterin-guanine dinucleotide biosynthesis protein A